MAVFRPEFIEALSVLADRLDETYLDKRIREETAGELGLEYLKEQAG
jgi:hypothetical protein